MVELTHSGKKFVFEEHKGGRPIKRLRSGKFYERAMLAFIKNLRPQHTIIDVGANIGNHTVYFAALTDCKEVLAVEPHPLLADKLKKNINNNSLGHKVRLHNVAAGSRKGTCGLEWEAEDKLGGTRTVDGDSTDMDTLDNLAGSKKVSAIKIDVEGHENEVLKGAQKILAEQSPHVFVEIWGKEAKRAVDRVLSPLGYRPVRVFNSSATYYYRKDHQFQKDIKGFIDLLAYQLSKYRLFRRTS